jgi:adenylate cyclase
MGKEIERKFKVQSREYKNMADGIYIHQGFLSTEKERVVRIRIKGNQGFLTIKGITKGATRMEYEYGIPVEDAKTLLAKLCLKPTIEKYRYHINFQGFLWEVDEFMGENEGLIIAEIELEDEDQQFETPPWVGEEVTYDPRYFNSNLIANPFSNWKDI